LRTRCTSANPRRFGSSGRWWIINVLATPSPDSSLNGQQLDYAGAKLDLLSDRRGLASALAHLMFPSV
jgi:hypothetical protein